MTKYFFIALLICLLFFQGGRLRAQTADKICNVMEFGAQADGVHKDTIAIQAAIDRCAELGGGTVRLLSGRYLSAPIFLKSRVTLEISADAVLLGSLDITDYQVALPNFSLEASEQFLGLVNAIEKTDVGIAGTGTIDGAGQLWWDLDRAARQRKEPETIRPRLVKFTRCQRVKVTDITLKNSPSFHLVPIFSEDIVIQNITIQAPPDSPNTDGIDLILSRRVQISGCKIDTGDDNIAIKSSVIDPAHPYAGSADITITDCSFLHGRGVAIGSGTRGGVNQVVVKHCWFRGTRSGLRIKSGRDRGGRVANIVYRDINMESVDTAISFTSYYPDLPQNDHPQAITATTPAFQDITITNLVAKGSTSAGLIVGLPEQPLFNIALNNVSIDAETGLVVRNATVQTTKMQVEVQAGDAFILEEKGRVKSE
jgi:polygalacturonase